MLDGRAGEQFSFYANKCMKAKYCLILGCDYLRQMEFKGELHSLTQH